MPLGATLDGTTTVIFFFEMHAVTARIFGSRICICLNMYALYVRLICTPDMYVQVINAGGYRAYQSALRWNLSADLVGWHVFCFQV